MDKHREMEVRGYYKRQWPGLTIYGVYVKSDYKEDEVWLAHKGNSHVYAYSTACPEGELGIEPYPTPYTPLTKEEFEAAQEREWLSVEVN